MIEWFIVVSMWLPSGEPHVTYRLVPGAVSKADCDGALKEDMRVVFGGMAAVKGDCQTFPPRPAGLPAPKPVAPKGAKNV